MSEKLAEIVIRDKGKYLTNVNLFSEEYNKIFKYNGISYSFSIKVVYWYKSSFCNETNEADVFIFDKEIPKISVEDKISYTGIKCIFSNDYYYEYNEMLYDTNFLINFFEHVYGQCDLKLNQIY